MRQKYEAFVKQLDSTGKIYPSLIYSEKISHPHNDLSFSDTQLRLKVQFIWNPRIDKHTTEIFNNWKVRCYTNAISRIIICTEFNVGKI